MAHNHVYAICENKCMVETKTKAQIDSEISSLNSGKADKSTTYTKTQVDTALAGKKGITSDEDGDWGENHTPPIGTCILATISGSSTHSTYESERLYTDSDHHKFCAGLDETTTQYPIRLAGWWEYRGYFKIPNDNTNIALMERVQ